MTKHQIIKSLRHEIRKLNLIIDHKIIHGQAYHHESRRHKFLTDQLNRLSPAKTSWFGRTMSFASMFML